MLESFAKMVSDAIVFFFQNFANNAIMFYANILVDAVSGSYNVLKLEFVKNGILYSQGVAFAILAAKVINESYMTYILYENGDPDADPLGLLIRSAQAVAIIVCLPWIIQEMFHFGTILAKDVANLSSGKMDLADWLGVVIKTTTSNGLAALIPLIIAIICFILINVQSVIRGAELVMQSVTGPFFALNLTAANKSMWDTWFRQLIIICVTQALQIYMVKGALSLMTTEIVPRSTDGKIIAADSLMMLVGWLWITVKCPNWLKQFAYSTGFGGAAGGAVKQGGMMAINRQMFRSMMKVR